MAAFTFPLEHAALAAGQAASLAAAGLLIGAIMLASRRVAHHAEVLAEKVGEPYGSMTLTLAAVLVEVVILGIAAVLGGLRHGEQPYNVDSGNTYVVMILTAIGISMIVPAFLPPAAGISYAIFTIAIMAVLYQCCFVRKQQVIAISSVTATPKPVWPGTAIREAHTLRSCFWSLLSSSSAYWPKSWPRHWMRA